jgi:hypothetical protein
MTTAVDLPNIDDGELRTETSLAPGAIRVRLAGSADTRVKAQLDQLLARVHGECLRAQATEVVVDLRDLRFMSSSCLKSLVTWLGAVQDLDASAQYVIRFLSNPQTHWQRRSLAALSCFAISLIRVEA